MRILLLNYEFPPLGGGAAPVTLRLAEALKEHSFDLITMGFRGLAAEEQQGNIHIYRVDCGRKRKERSNVLEMARYIRQALKKGRELCRTKKYDLIHCHFIIPTGYVARKLNKEFSVPYIISCHGSDVPGYNPDRFEALHKILKPLWNRIIDDARIVLAPSQHLANLVLKNYRGKTPVKSVYWGMETIPKPSRKEKTIVFAGRLFERKGAQYLVEAVRGMDLKGYKVIIVGDGPMRRELEQKAEDDKRITFTGWMRRDKLLQLYAKSGIFAFPSTQESFGMVVVEAMAAGMAVVAANDSALPEVLGETGILVEPKNTESIRKALEDLISHPKKMKELGAKARKRAMNFTWKKAAQKYQEIYQDYSKSI